MLRGFSLQNGHLRASSSKLVSSRIPADIPDIQDILDIQGIQDILDILEILDISDVQDIQDIQAILEIRISWISRISGYFQNLDGCLRASSEALNA